MFLCPICKNELTKTENGVKCKKNHSFDFSAQGYLHLLPSNKMHSKIPGDNKQMVNARKDFLNAGYYDIFIDGVAQVVFDQCKNIKSPVILDAGCGEGTYTGKIASKFETMEIDAFDISKFAVKSAATRYKNINFAVASIFDIPVKSDSVDCLVSVFSPIAVKEFKRIVKKGGCIVMAVPGPYHLWEMKEILYEKPYLNETQDTQYDGFQLEKRIPLQQSITLESKNMIENLFSMTPYYYKTAKESSDKLFSRENLTTKIHFDLLIYRRV